MGEITDMEIVKVGIVGIGNMGGTHLACIMDGKIEGMTVTAVCDIDAAQAACSKRKISDAGNLHRLQRDAHKSRY